MTREKEQNPLKCIAYTKSISVGKSATPHTKFPQTSTQHFSKEGLLQRQKQWPLNSPSQSSSHQIHKTKTSKSFEEQSIQNEISVSRHTTTSRSILSIPQQHSISGKMSGTTSASKLLNSLPPYVPLLTRLIIGYASRGRGAWVIPTSSVLP